MQITHFSPEPPQPLLSHRPRAPGHYWFRFIICCLELHSSRYLPRMNQSTKGKMQKEIRERKRKLLEKDSNRICMLHIMKAILSRICSCFPPVSSTQAHFLICLRGPPAAIDSIPQTDHGCDCKDATPSHSAELALKSNQGNALQRRDVPWSRKSSTNYPLGPKLLTLSKSKDVLVTRAF